MAAAEARAAFQRTVNRCFVQEDAKRAPRLACCQSSSSTSKQVDSGPTSAADGPDHPSIGFMPLNRNSSSCSSLSDSKWWLQTQPSYGYQKIFTSEHINALDASGETLSSGPENPCNDIRPPKGSGTSCDNGFSAICTKKTNNMMDEDIKAIYTRDSEELIETVYVKENYECLEMDSLDCKTVSKNQDEFDFEPDSPWIEGDKTEPWWWITDRDELAYLVAQKSLDPIENCDLPPPKKSCLNFKRDPCLHQKHCSIDDRCSVLTFNSTHQHHGLDCCDFGETAKELRGSIEQGKLLYGSQKSLSYTNSKNSTKTIEISEDNASKAELMDALLHSQTRAREAENAAKRAYAENEHILELFFKQASQLFAYKQWFQLLQLENLQLKNNDQPISTLFPLVLPWMTCKSMVSGKRWQRFARRKRVKRGRHRGDFSSYAVAFALGLSMVSAGLLLGWTIGWMLPAF